MNIDINTKFSTNATTSSSATKIQGDDITTFAEELSAISDEGVGVGVNEGVNDGVNEGENQGENQEKSEDENVSIQNSDIDDGEQESQQDDKFVEKDSVNTNNDLGLVFDGLEDVVVQMNNKLSQTDENFGSIVKDDIQLADKNIINEDNVLINNDMNIPEQNDKLTFQMNANMNFNSNGQSFTEFMNSQAEHQIASTKKELAEEEAILSTMSENIAIANRNMMIKDANAQNLQENNTETKTVINSEGIKKVDKHSNITVETVVKYDTVVMNESDVDFFVKLVEQRQAEVKSLEALKSSNISKALADLIAKAMNDNKPVRIDFDNNISVIIRISKDGKISADFLPSSQVAEAYLKENLPLLKQRFDENNIEYDELNQRKYKQNEKENQKKERNHE